MLPLGLLLALPGSILKMRRRGSSWREFRERCGFYGQETRQRLALMNKPFWLHAVSVGEVLVARKLIAELVRQRPDTDIVLSTTTSTGYAVARQNAPPGLQVIHNPLDLRACVRRALDAIQPGQLVLIEAEVWPNLVTQSRKWGVPVSLANARLSPRSERRYRRWHYLVSPFFSLLDKVFVPEPEDCERWIAIGVRAEAIAVAGGVKHDYEAEQADARVRGFEELLGALWGRPLPPLLLVASTHSGEEAALARVYLSLRRKFPRLKLLVAPRHFERAASVMQELQKLGLVTGRRSQSPKGDLDAFIIDTTGELRGWQALADVVVIGKSFLSTGGQNPVEALMAGRPVVFGPHMENFASLVAALLSHKGAIQVSSLDELEFAICRLLENPDAARQLVENGRRVLAPHQGAARRTAQALLAAEGIRE